MWRWFEWSFKFYILEKYEVHVNMIFTDIWIQRGKVYKDVFVLGTFEKMLADKKLPDDKREEIRLTLASVCEMFRPVFFIPVAPH